MRNFASKTALVEMNLLLELFQKYRLNIIIIIFASLISGASSTGLIAIISNFLNSQHSENYLLYYSVFWFIFLIFQVISQVF